MTTESEKFSPKRRQLLVGTAIAGFAAAAGMVWPKKWKPLLDGDIAATTAHDLFDRGLVPVNMSGWTIPEGVQSDYPSLQNSISVDIVIIGAGLAGTSLALHLTELGVRVAVLEARQPGWGASGRNAGHVLPVLKDMSVLSSFPDEGKQFLELFREHHTIPFDLSEKYQIDCDAVKSGYLNAMVGDGALEDFRNEMSYLEKSGMQKLETVAGEDMTRLTGSKHWTHGLIYPDGGRVNPYLLSNGMAKTAIKLGAKIFANSEALEIHQVQKKWRVNTANGSVTADRAVFCTNAYPTAIVPEFANSFYPLTAYALTTKTLSADACATIMPGGQTLAQVPIDLNPLVKDRHNRLILSSIPNISKPEDAVWHFRNQLDWLHNIWPSTKDMDIELETYWTGRVAMRDVEFPGVYEAQPGVYGLMHFNAWGNVMAPLMGKLFAEGLASDMMDKLPFPIGKAEPVSNPGKQDRNIRQWMIPAARQAQSWGIL
ncbi:MAG: FAD-dependent oxidoreductase [Sphingorhabdus sp.]